MLLTPATPAVGLLDHLGGWQRVYSDRNAVLHVRTAIDRPPPWRERNQSLDLLRGVAILLVVLAHCSQSATGAVPGLSSFAEKYGELGVQLFFIVSGYTMMLTFGGKVDPAAIRSFYLRRVFRIVPLFWIAIVFYLLITKGAGIRALGADGVVPATSADVPVPARGQRHRVQLGCSRRMEHRR